MNRKVVIAASAFLVLLSCLAGFYHFSSSSSSDTRLYATDQSTGQKYPLAFLYAVDESTGKIQTYSPFIGQVVGEGNLKQSNCFVAVESTATGISTSCNRVEAGDGNVDGDSQPFLSWLDMQDQNQQQFFNNGQVVFITEQPLKEGVDHYLVAVPSSTAD